MGKSKCILGDVELFILIAGSCKRGGHKVCGVCLSSPPFPSQGTCQPDNARSDAGVQIRRPGQLDDPCE